MRQPREGESIDEFVADQLSDHGWRQRFRNGEEREAAIRAHYDAAGEAGPTPFSLQQFDEAQDATPDDTTTDEAPADDDDVASDDATDEG